MPQFASFVSMRPQPGGGAGFPIGEGLDITRDGKLHLKFASDGPLYVNENGEINVRVGSGMRIATGSPPSIVALPVTVTSDDIRDTSSTTSVTGSIRRLTAIISALQAQVDAIVTSPIRARGSTTLSGGSKTVSTANVTSGDLIFLSYGAISGVPGSLNYENVVDGVSFDITSSSGAIDDSDVAWMVVSP